MCAVRYPSELIHGLVSGDADRVTETGQVDSHSIDPRFEPSGADDAVPDSYGGLTIITGNGPLQREGRCSDM